MNKNIKFLGLGLIGGMLPLSLSMVLNGNPYQSLSDQVIDGNRIANARNVNFTGNAAAIGPDFVQASQSSINAVVHVTTKVVRTAVQRGSFL